MNDCKGYLCKYPEGDESRTSSVQFSYSNFVIYDGKAPMVSPCVDAIHLTYASKYTKNLPNECFRKEGR